MSGFTLIEMLTVIAIFTIITAIILFNLPSFKGSTNLDLVAQEVSLHIRGAQLYTTATRSSGVTGETDKFLSYGLHFDLSSPASRSFFSLYGFTTDGSSINYRKDNIEIYRLPKGYEISKVCVGSGATSCSNAGGDTCTSFTSDGLKYLDLAFIRPNPESYTCIYKNIDVGCSKFSSERTTICVRAKRINLEQMIEVSPAGQISVKKAV
jgi:prepilin-type N-terminal cleavage/methylation domain-containing protein